ncbi:hypothetical protein [Cysteiniphilum marinum]|nr:hypothetical protein [Cysteiniphilum marinum]
MQIFSKRKKLTSKKAELKARLVSVVKWDRYAQRQVKNQANGYTGGAA